MIKISVWQAAVLAALLTTSTALQAQWFPLEVDVWQPPYNSEHQRSTITYQALPAAGSNWRICVLIPHLKDPYWLAVNYGLISEARRLGVAISLFEAGGYDHLDVQRQQVADCLDQDYDGLIVSAITPTGLNDLLAAAAEKAVPVVDLINGLAPEHITARVAADYWDNAYLTGRYLVEQHNGNAPTGRVAWFPGPEGAGWVAAGDAGFRSAIEDANLQIVATRKGDTGRATQRLLIEEVLAQTPDLDYLVGTTVTAEAAIEVLRSRGLADQIKVLSYYYSPGVHRGIRRGSIMAAPSDQQVLQARIAVDVMVRILEGHAYQRHVAPQAILVDRIRLSDWDESTSLPPRGFRPIFSLGH